MSFWQRISFLWAVVVLLCASAVHADDFAADVNLSPLRSVAVQHKETLKTFDTFARQTIDEITDKSSLDGHDALFVLLDMTYRPADYARRNLIKIKNVPLRSDLTALSGLSLQEQSRIAREGTISLEFWWRPEVQALFRQVESGDVRKTDAVLQLAQAAGLMSQICGSGGLFFPPAAVIAPPNGNDTVWKTMAGIAGNVPEWSKRLKSVGMKPSAQAGYDDALLQRIATASEALSNAWVKQDAPGVNRAAAALAELLPQVNPAVYPSKARRSVEIIYNRLLKMTIPAAAFYFAAFVCFLMSAYSGVGSLQRWGLRLMVVAFFVHTLGIAVRWWLVGDVFPPIKNEFESVMFSAWFGAAVGLGLERWQRRGIFGAAASFVGWLALVAIFAVPFVSGKQIGGEIGQVSGVLMSYWLYIHVTLVTAGYALIAMGFLLSVWWLVRYYRSAAAKSFLVTLDQCNLVILQLAFWVLGGGIICGAIWADQSWGRPWGWDPKETFALVTWIVYLIVVHVRVAVVDKAWWTSVLAILGFFVMLFNWIGVNFFLVGLHSYA